MNTGPGGDHPATGGSDADAGPRSDTGLSPDAAYAEIVRIRRSVGRSAAQIGWIYLLWGIASLLYWPAMFFAPSPVPRVAMVAWLAMTALSVVYAYRQRVYEHSGLQGRVSLAWVAVMAGVALFGLYVLPDDPSGWWVAAGLALAVVSALPVLYAAWRIRPWGGAR
ncbi:hypothetical protein Sme01_66890 [Sphaerisporangium melleum]|uniref:Uncharacterized protein n=1 Tax=Sphaerisporangium melleum TaxID=321316 RepID=A0A917VRD6_9ACTN|nr:hypothetical protein [Sphaerisporangium melleum]GGL06603.1 hypothetical protein GCM10007964_56120 [Sphaerisporangium melleum]GII74213.1 hypothetical protein Sme01_66890 [Sphaerisporangium melleum]